MSIIYECEVARGGGKNNKNRASNGVFLKGKFIDLVEEGNGEVPDDIHEVDGRWMIT